MMAGWANQWTRRGGGWDHKASLLARHDPIRKREILAGATPVEIAACYVSFLCDATKTDFAWDDKID